MRPDETPEAPRIIWPGQPLPRDPRCPRCQAPPERRVLSAGFGDPHDVCGRCGYEFEERTIDA